MFFILLLVGLVMGDGFGGTAKADLVVTRDSDDKTWRWVMVSDPASGRTAFGVYRQSTELMVWRSECWPTAESAESRLDSLMAMPFETYEKFKGQLPPAALGVALDCGPRIAKRLLKEFYPE